MPGEGPPAPSGAGGAGSFAGAAQGSVAIAGAPAVGGAGAPSVGASGSSTSAEAGNAGSGGSDPGLLGWPRNPTDARTETLPAGTVQYGWGQLDIGRAANYDDANGATNPGVCPDPDEMKTPGTVHFANGVWTLTGSGEGFIHGWDQGNLVYFKTKISGDFTFTMKVEKFEMTNGKQLDGAAEALLNVRQDLNSKRPTHSVIAGAAPSKAIFMARYPWEGEGDRWWHWPAFPATWPDHREILSWTRLVARGSAISAESSADGQAWQVVEHNDSDSSHPAWYPFKLAALVGERYVGLVCSARNDRNYAPLVKLPGKSADCRDPSSPHLLGAARCVFSNVTLTQP